MSSLQFHSSSCVLDLFQSLMIRLAALGLVPTYIARRLSEDAQDDEDPEAFEEMEGERVFSACAISMNDSINIPSLLAARAVWLNLGPPRQPEGRRPEGCRGGPRCSQTAPAARRDCVSWNRYSTRTENARKIELEEKAF